jgi:hypothetical protein
MDKLFEILKEKLGEEVMTEDFQNDLQANIDIMVNDKVKEKVAEEKKALDETTAKELSEFKDDMVTKMDEYIEYVVDEYVKENKVAIESNHKVEMADAIIEATKKVFADHHVELPEDKVDVVKSMEESVSDAKDKLNKEINDKIDVKRENDELKRTIIFMQETKEMTDTDVENVKNLMEGLEYGDEEDYKKKLKIVMDKVNTDDEEIKEEVIADKDKADDKENLDEDIADKDDEKKNEIDKYLN